MTASVPANFPIYGIPWLIAEAVQEFAQINYEPVDMDWADQLVAVLLIGDPDAPETELEFRYDGISKVSIHVWEWNRKENPNQDFWGQTIDKVFDLVEADEVAQLTTFLKEHCEDQNVKLQYCPKSES